MNAADTIFALSSGKLPSGVCVFRISGPKTRFVVETIAGVVPPPRKLHWTKFKDHGGQIIDSGLVCCFEAPGSYTGEDSAEFHVHGSVAVSRRLSAVLADLDGLRAAEPGEFTKRAFLNGKLDLAEAEGLSDLLVAETESQRRLAVNQMGGALSSLYRQWRERLVSCRAMIEASIDFVEEDDGATGQLSLVYSEIDLVHQQISDWLVRSRNSEIVNDGFKVVVLGPPNAGKSSLLNSLAGRDVAIVNEEPGTTRDLIDIRLEIGGNLVILTDTAGIREPAGRVEAAGIEKAVVRGKTADLVIWLQDVCGPESKSPDLGSAPVLKVGNKADLVSVVPIGFDVLISVKTGEGIQDLLDSVLDAVNKAVGMESLLTVHERQKSLLAACLDSLGSARLAGRSVDLVAEDLRMACDAIGRLTGDVDVEEILGVIFSRFCIGK